MYTNSQKIEILKSYQKNRMPNDDEWNITPSSKKQVKKQTKILRKAHDIFREYLEREDANEYIHRTFSNFLGTSWIALSERELTNAIEYLIADLEYTDKIADCQHMEKVTTGEFVFNCRLLGILQNFLEDLENNTKDTIIKRLIQNINERVNIEKIQHAREIFGTNI